MADDPEAAAKAAEEAEEARKKEEEEKRWKDNEYKSVPYLVRDRLVDKTYRYAQIALAITTFFLPLLFVSPIPGKNGAFIFRASYEQDSTSIAVGLYHCAIPDEGGTVYNPDSGKWIYVSPSAPSCNSLDLSFLQQSTYLATQIFVPLTFVAAVGAAILSVYIESSEVKDAELQKFNRYTMLVLILGVVFGCFSVGFSAVITYNANVKYGVYLTMGGAYWFCIIFGTVMLMIASISLIVSYLEGKDLKDLPPPFNYFYKLKDTSMLSVGLFLTAGLLLLCCLFTGYIDGKNGAYIFRAVLEDNYSVVVGPYYCAFPDLYINFTPPYGDPVSLNPANTYCSKAKFSFMKDAYHVASGVFLALALTSTLVCVLIFCYTVTDDKSKREFERKKWRPRIFYVLLFGFICCGLTLAFNAVVTYNAKLNHSISLTIGGAYWACLVVATVLMLGCIVSFMLNLQHNFRMKNKLEGRGRPAG